MNERAALEGGSLAFYPIPGRNRDLRAGYPKKYRILGIVETYTGRHFCLHEHVDRSPERRTETIGEDRGGLQDIVDHFGHHVHHLDRYDVHDALMRSPRRVFYRSNGACLPNDRSPGLSGASAILDRPGRK